MAELGAIAAAVQLVDVALRVSGEVRNFLDAYKDTGRDVKALRDALRDVEANVRNMVRYAAEFKKSKYAVEEFEVLSETIINSLEGYNDEIVTAKKLLPPKPAEKIRKQLHWVLHKGEAEDLMRRLNERNGRLITALEITGRLHDLRIRQDISKTIVEQAVLSSATLKQQETLDQSIQKQDHNHAQALLQSNALATSIDDLRTCSTRGHEAVISDISRQFKIVNRKSKRTDDKLSLLKQEMHKSNTTLRSIKSQTQRKAQRSEQSLNAMLHETRTQTTFVSSSIDMTAKVVREELHSTLKPVIEQAFASSNTHIEAYMQRLENLIQKISHDVGSHALIQPFRSLDDMECQRVESLDTFSRHCAEHSIHEVVRRCEPHFLSDHCQRTESVSVYQHKWFQQWKIGSLEVEITHINRRVDGSPHANSAVKIQVCFRPSQSLLRLPGISVFYTTAPDSHGYYHLAPMIATFPIIDIRHPAFQSIRSGDLGQLKNMLANGEAHLRCEDIYGRTLLHCAAYCGHLETCKFLALQGLYWDHPDVNNGIRRFTPTHFLLQNVFYKKHSKPTTRLRYLEEMNLLDDASRELPWFGGPYPELSQGDHDEISEVCRKMRSRPEEVWRRASTEWAQASIDNILNPGSLFLLEVLLSEGLDPNSVAGRSFCPLLWYAFWCLRRAKEQELMQAPRGSVDEPGTQPSVSSGHTVDFLCMVRTLLKSGADLYHMVSVTFDHATAWWDIRTHCTNVIKWGVRREWEMALYECGLEPEKVYQEDEQRRKQAMRLHGAKRSGVDEEVLELPPSDGLRCRICRGKHCLQHHRGILEDLRWRGD